MTCSGSEGDVSPVRRGKGRHCGSNRERDEPEMARVVFLHPDLGIGGAERLVVDAAVALKSQGCDVQIWTAHHDPTHCFSETLDPDLPVVCVGDWLPTSVFGYLHAMCAYLRMIYVALYLVFLSGVEYDVIFCDQVSSYSNCLGLSLCVTPFLNGTMS
uniref:ALG2 alpha-1,3/1,6-mannosyltransferase n=1 Tax=Scophthalmus maximus TaxID=52904 RepID=A0A8D3CX82_SCOMX